MSEFDLVVVGGSSGGVRAARIAASHGARVALVEEYRLGDTSVIRGCVPKKLTVYGSRFAQEIGGAGGCGWALGKAQFDWATLKTRRDAEVARLEGLYRNDLLAAGVQIFAGRARLADHNTVTLPDGTELGDIHILIATGSMPTGAAAIPGQSIAIDSNGFFDLLALPRRVVVQGAGYIALELACVLQRLGAQVHVVVRGDHILPGFDDDVRTHLRHELLESGLTFDFGRSIGAITQTGDGLKVELNQGETVAADCVLRALCRKPLTQGLGLDAEGAVPVDAFSQTAVPNIHAVGDATNRVNLTPIEIREGHAFADTVFAGTPRSVDHTLVPTALFTTPELGVVGLTKQAALQQYPRLDVYKTVFRPMKATLSGHAGKVLFKLLVDLDTDRVPGFHGVGPDTGEMAQLMGVALQLKGTKSALNATLAVHPTAAEEMVTMHNPTVQHGL